MIIDSIPLFRFLRLNHQSPKIKHYLLEERDGKSFRCSYISKRDDEIFIRYIAAQQTIEWIVESNSFKDIINYIELHQIYGLSRLQSKAFFHSKDDYIKIAKTLPFMMSEILFICPCDKIFDNYFWNHFDCCITFQEDDTLKCFTPKKSKKVNFKNLNELITHVTKFKCNHHIIIAKYL